MRSTASSWYAIVVLAAFGACARLPSCAGDALAEVTAADGRVERDYTDRRGQWERTARGAELRLGDGLRTGAKSTAVLRVGKNGTLRVEPDTTLRLQLSGDSATAQDSPGLEVETGHAVLEAGEAQLPFRTAFGTAVLQPGTQLRLSRAEQGVRYEVVMGAAAFAQNDGRTEQVRAGQSIVVGIGMAVLEAPGAAPASAAALASPHAQDTAPQPADAAPLAERADEAAVQAIVRGEVRRRARGAQAWAALPAGDALLAAGDELHVREDGRAELTRGDERATLSRGRYEIGAPGAPIVRASDGKLHLYAERAVVVISVPGGTIVAEPAPGGSRADVVVNGADGSTAVEVLAGNVKTVGPDGEARLEAGEQATLAASVVKANAGRAPAAKRSAERADLIVPAGESFRVYDPSPPTSIGFNLDKRCPEGGEVRVEGHEPARGQRQVNVLVGPGLRGYRVYCVGADRPAVTASLRVLRSDGTRRPPTKPTRNDVDVDGRQYTLMYQNLRPILSVRWPDAPRSSGYTLQLRRPDSSVKTLHAKRPRATIEPRLLADGVHALQFTTSGTKRERSKETKVKLVFDNAAPTASLVQPPPSGFVRGASTAVSGVALAGSRASIGSRAIRLDKAGRFSVDVPLAPGQRALAVRFKHGKHGIRYYLRRAAGGDP